MRTRSQRQDAKDEANWRDLQLERNGLLDPGQPTETATVIHQRKIRRRLARERWLAAE